MKGVRLLHISDLHARVDNADDQRLLVREMLDDMARLQDERPVDIVIFTGDLTFSGKDAEFELARELLLAPIADRLGIDRSRIVLAPGNHDVDRALIDRFTEVGLATELKDRDTVNRLLDDEAGLRSALRRLTAWHRFTEDFYRDVDRSITSPLSVIHSFDIRGISVGVAALNSAWRASGGPEDYRKLLLGDRQVDNAMSAIANNDVRCAAMHHPLEWLAPFDSDQTRQQFERRGLVLCTGHLHEARPEMLVTSRGSVVFSQVGSLYESRDHHNSFTVLDVDLDTKQARTLVRTWWPDRGEFDEGTNVASHGAVLLPLSNAISCDRAIPDYNAVLFGLGTAVRQKSIIADSLVDQESVTVDDLLIPPRFWPVPHKEVVFAAGEPGGIEVRESDALAALAADNVLIVVGDPEAGVSSALYWLLDKHFRATGDLIPICVTFDRRFDRKRATRAIATELAALGIRATRDDEFPPLLCAIDDIQLHDPRAVARLAEYIFEHPTHRFILGSRSADHKQLAQTLSDRHVPFRRVFLGPLSRRDQRALAEKIVGPGNTVVAGRVAHILRREGIPRSPFHLAVLISVVAVQPNPTLVNESTILLSYVERLLGRGELADIDETGMDYRVREHALGFFAYHLYSVGKKRLSRLETEVFFGEYFLARGLTAYSAGNLVNSLVRRRILFEDGGGVAFRHLSVQYLFVALWMREDPRFEAVVVNDPVGNRDVVHHAAALKRSDRTLLEATLSAARSSLDAVASEVRIDLFDAIRSTPGWSDRPSLEQLKLLLTTAPPDHDRVERELDAADDRSEHGISVVAAFKLPSALERMCRAVLLLSDVLRSSELVDDVSLKEAALRLAVHGWGLVEVVVAVVEDQAHLLHELFSDTLKAEGFDGDPSPIIDDLVTTWIALLTAFMAAGSLMSPHLAAALPSLLRDAKFMKSSAHALFTTLLASQLETRHWPELLVRLYEQHRRHPVARDFARNWALILYRESRGTPEELKKLEEFLADVYTEGKRARGREAVLKRAQARNDVIRQLRESTSQSRTLAGQANASDEAVVESRRSGSHAIRLSPEEHTAAI